MTGVCLLCALLSVPQVHCVGHLVCAVIADSETRAKQAAKQVKVVYRDLEPLILTIEVRAQADGGSGSGMSVTVLQHRNRNI